MPVSKPRSRIVSFRLSPEEYEAMRDRCINQGARSISDFARASACRSVTGEETLRKDLETELVIQDLKQRVDDLGREVQRLSLMLARLRTLEVLFPEPQNALTNVE